MTKSVVILPSRNRQHRIGKTILSLREHTKVSDIIVSLDEDDHMNYQRFAGVNYEVGPVPTRVGMNQKMNRMVDKLKNDYDYILWAADDTVVQTPGWDEILIDAIRDVPFGISYPNDLFQGENLPSNGTCFDSRIVHTLGYLAPPALYHLYLDNFWKLLGSELGTLRYKEDVIVEHFHYVNKKALNDPAYESVNSRAMYDADRTTYQEYVNNGLAADLKKIRDVLEQ
jgi:hypothetical protein